MRLGGNLPWALLLGLVTFTPLTDAVVGIVPWPWLLAPIQGILIGLLLARILRGSHPDHRSPAREWSLSPQAALGILLALAMWWDPYGWATAAARLLAGGGLLEGGLDRLARGGATLGALVLTWRGLRPAQSRVAARKLRAARTTRKKREASSNPAAAPMTKSQP